MVFQDDTSPCSAKKPSTIIQQEDDGLSERISSFKTGLAAILMNITKQGDQRVVSKLVQSSISRSIETNMFKRFEESLVDCKAVNDKRSNEE